MPNTKPAADAAALLQGIARGATTSASLMRDLLGRIAARDAVVRAWAHLDPAQALAAAEASDRAGGAPPLHGLPVAIKDVILTRDMPTRYNCALYADGVTGPDAACVAMLRQAGAVIMGKTATVELASIGAPPATTNPHARGHTPGGSSSGSAAAVADGQVPLALGTQTGGSTLRPASFCGVWGFKPTYGLVSMDGVKPFAPSLDTLGWFGRSAADMQLLLDIFDPIEVPSDGSASLAGASVALWHMPGWEAAGPNTRAAMASAERALRNGGARVESLVLPESLAELGPLHARIMLGEGARSFRREYRQGASALHPRIAEMVRTEGGVLWDELRDAQDGAARARPVFDAVVERYDAVLAPSTLDVAPAGLTATGDLVFNAPLTLLHAPCVNVPVPRAGAPLPVGVTLTGARGTDRRVLAVAALLAQALAPGHAPVASRAASD